jgi:hypothetical protein
MPILVMPRSEQHFCSPRTILREGTVENYGAAMALLLHERGVLCYLTPLINGARP